jgi:hypothetical protein
MPSAAVTQTVAAVVNPPSFGIAQDDARAIKLMPVITPWMMP